MSVAAERSTRTRVAPQAEPPRRWPPAQHRTPGGPGPAGGAHRVTAPDRRPVPPRSPTRRQTATRYAWALVRLALGWTFLWAFLDKTFGLGHATPAEAAWIAGGRPTQGFLQHATDGPLTDFYRGLAGAVWVDWLFMIGLAGIGSALLLGIGLRVAAVAGAALYVMMWSAVLPPATNPFLDEHLIFAVILIGLALAGAGHTLGFGRSWARLPLVQRQPWLR
jgi:thiosulfate dehydrogenase (quinone) large subunit